MPAPQGNTNNMKWPTPEQRIEACKALCEELSQGFPKEYLKTADWDTIQRYMKDFPVEFPSETIEEAIRVGRQKLLTTGYAGMLGKIPGFKEKTWQFIIQNMTNWKLRTDVTSDDKKIESPTIFIPAEEVDEEVSN